MEVEYETISLHILSHDSESLYGSGTPHGLSGCSLHFLSGFYTTFLRENVLQVVASGPPHVFIMWLMVSKAP